MVRFLDVEMVGELMREVAVDLKSSKNEVALLFEVSGCVRRER